MSSPLDLNHWHDRPPLRSDAARTQRQQLRDTISNSLMRLNALAPISYMPPEILGTIFSIACEDSSTSSRPTVMDISHVCRQWRRVAIEHSTLWTVPPLKLGCNWTKAFLSRSRSAPLAIETSYAEESVQVLMLGMIQPIHDHLSHIRRFQITARYDTLDLLLATLITPAPMLRSVEIEANTDTILSTIPRHIFAGDAPELKYLILNNCLIPWDSTIFRNLVSLHIALPSNDTSRAVNGYLIPTPIRQLLPTMSQLVGVLSACPLLRSLGLQNALPQALFAPIARLDQTLQAVHLSNLVIVELRGMPHECERFLSHIIFPAYSNLVLDGWAGQPEDVHNPEAEFSALLNLHKNRAYSSTAEDFSSSFLRFHYLPDELEVIAANVNTRIALPPTPLDHRIVTDFARQFFAFTPLAECVSLSVGFEDDIPFSQEELLDIFAHDYLHCIDEVTWGGSGIGIAAFCAALSARGEALPANPASSPGFLVFPHLKLLGVSYVNFSDPTDREILWTSAVGLQADRKARGSPIQKFVFTACRGLSEEWTDALQSSSMFEETEVQFHSR